MNYGIKSGDGFTDILQTKDVSKILFSNKYEMFKVFTERTAQIPSGGTLNITHNLLYAPIFLIYGKSNITVNYKMLCTAARLLTGYRTSTTTSIASVIDNSSSGVREAFVHILEDPISFS